MGINLQKGQKIDLTKGGGGLSSVMVGLGWDAADNGAGLAIAIDCDASAILCGADGRLVNRENMKESLVYYANLTHPSQAIWHMGDNLTGDGDGDDEQIMVDLPRVPEHIHKIIFVVNIYRADARNQHFGMLSNAFIRLVNVEKKTEICRFELNENYDQMTGLVVGEIYRRNGEWKFNAIGQPLRDGSNLRNIVALYL